MTEKLSIFDIIDAIATVIKNGQAPNCIITTRLFPRAVYRRFKLMNRKKRRHPWGLRLQKGHDHGSEHTTTEH